MNRLVLIVGGGPAGLGAAIGAAKAGGQVIVCERGTVGETPKGETLHYSSELERHLGKGCYDEFSLNHVDSRVICTPGGHRLLKENRALHVTDWRALLAVMKRAAQNAGAEVREQTPVRTVAGGPRPFAIAGDESFGPGAIILADGPQSSLRKMIGLPPILSYPIYKELHTGYTGQQEMLELHADFDPTHPGVYFVFPRGADRVEIGTMIFRDGREATPFVSMGPHLTARRDKIPADAAKHRLQSLLADREDLSEPLAHSESTFNLTTYLPMARIEPSLVVQDRLYLVGDNAGTVEGRGGSGVLASFLLGVEVGTIAAESITFNWTAHKVRHYQNRALRQHPVYRKIRKTQKLPIPLMQTLLRQPRRLVETAWPVLSRAI